MKKYLFIVLIFFAAGVSAQTNTFPSSGNVGIGTTAPDAKFQVVGNGSSMARIGPDCGSNYVGISLNGALGSCNNYSLLGGDGNLFINRPTGGSILFRDNNITQMILLDNGNVGIGTASPSYRLDVANQIRVGAQGGSDVTLISGGSGYGSTLSQYYADGTLKNFFAANQNSYITGGSLGIGTTAPSQKLGVNGNIIVYPASSSWAEGLSFSMPTTNTWGGLRWRRERGNNDGNWYIGYIGLDATDDLVFGSNNGGTQVDNILRLTKTGNVGIGTASPSEKLSVNGNIRSKKLIVTLTGWADYVFNKNYKLKPLSEVEQFIKTNKHLPEVPSAKQVEKDGIDVGDNEALLLKKIEELTLYMIDQNKKIDDLKKEIERLKTKN